MVFLAFRSVSGQLAPPRPRDVSRARHVGRRRLARGERRPASRTRGEGRRACPSTRSRPCRSGRASTRRSGRSGTTCAPEPRVVRPRRAAGLAHASRRGDRARGRGVADVGRAAAAALRHSRGDPPRLRRGPRRRGGRDQRLHEPGPSVRDRRGARERAPAGLRAPAHRPVRRGRHRLGAARRRRAGRAAGRRHAGGVRLLVRGRDEREAAGRDDPARQGGRALSLVRGGRRLHRRLLRPLRDRQRPAGLRRRPTSTGSTTRPDDTGLPSKQAGARGTARPLDATHKCHY